MRGLWSLSPPARGWQKSQIFVKLMTNNSDKLLFIWVKLKPLSLRAKHKRRRGNPVCVFWFDSIYWIATVVALPRNDNVFLFLIKNTPIIRRINKKRCCAWLKKSPQQGNFFSLRLLVFLLFSLRIFCLSHSRRAYLRDIHNSQLPGLTRVQMCYRTYMFQHRLR